MKVFFGTVVYKSAFKYINEFLLSLNSQVYKDFDLLIINDNVSSIDLNYALDNYYGDYEIVHYCSQLTPVQLRIKLLQEAKNRNAELLIMGDFDDLFSANRIEKIVNCANVNNDYTFYYNTILSFDNKPVMPELPIITNNINNVADYNYLGLSNTAIRMNELPTDFINSLEECKQMIFDWYLFTRLIIEGMKGLYVPEAFTLYRFHENNLVGLQENSPENIQREVKVKTEHYRSLKDKSTIMRRRFDVYNNNLFKVKKVSSLSYWWDFTTGGK